MSHVLCYPEPATRWAEALPLGNGRLGAMVFGQPGDTLFQLNEETWWSGSPANADREPRLGPEEARDVLRRARAALAEGDFAEADRQVTRLQHRFSQTYLPLADLRLLVCPTGTDPTDPVSGLSRELDLRAAVHTLRYRCGDATVHMRSTVSRVHGVLLIDVATSDPGLRVRAVLTSPVRTLGLRTGRDQVELRLGAPADIGRRPGTREPTIEYSDDPLAALQAVVRLRVIERAGVLLKAADYGPLQDAGETAIEIDPGARLTLAVSAHTTFRAIGRAPTGDLERAARAAVATLDALAGLSWETLSNAHTLAHRRLYDRVDLSFDDSARRSPPEGDASPAERLRNAAHAPAGGLPADPDLAALLFHYGRYLLIASSCGARLPSTLQGIWNAEFFPPWSSKFTLNINLEMNYWGAEVTDLPEAEEPLFHLIEALARTGSQTARQLYDAPGWVAHHNTDAWAYTRPEGLNRLPPRTSGWPMAGPWLVRHLVDRLDFTDDPVAARRAWPLARSAAQFMLHWLQPSAEGLLGTAPSTSPENRFRVDADPDGPTFSTGVSSTLDLTLIAELFDSLERLAALLGRREDPVVVATRSARPRIRGPQVGRDGLIREWAADPPQVDRSHRHLSHLYFAFPGVTPPAAELQAAVSASLDARGDDSTGWSLIWKMALRARLGQGDKVEDLLRLLFRPVPAQPNRHRGGLYPNFFAAHPPFQIDANLGYVGALTETLLQSHADTLHLLPALPPSLASGTARGLVARPGVRVDLRWHDRRLTSAVLTARRPTTRTVRWGDERLEVTLAAGVPFELPTGRAGATTDEAAT